MTRKFIVGVDVDDTVAGLVPAWLEEYNFDWNDILTIDGIHDWNMIPYVKKECGKHIYDYLNDPKLYDIVKPIPLSLAGINSLRSMGHRVFFVTSATMAQQGRKAQWLMDYKFIDNLDDYVCATDKSLIRCDILIDDRYENVVNTTAMGILFSRPWNLNKEWKLRVDNWWQIIDLMKGLNY